jgi:hypothetical protein
MTAQLAMFDLDAYEIIREKMNMAFAANLSDCERAVLSLMNYYQAFGKDFIISTDRMHSIWQSRGEKVHDRRKVRAAIKTLIEVYDLPIGSSRTPGDNGYFFCVLDAEAEAATQHLKNEIMSLFRRIKVLSPKSDFVRKLNGQLQLLSEESNEESSVVRGS